MHEQKTTTKRREKKYAFAYSLDLAEFHQLKIIKYRVYEKRKK